jgi:hypothetical protein
VSPEIKAYFSAQQPDVAMITPLVDLGSPQLDHLAAARALGLRTILPVGSWDHLSSKAFIRNVPDRILVWNHDPEAEAVEMHGVPAGADYGDGRASLRLCGSSGTPSRSRASFCERVGLRSDRPFILYLCSSLFRGTASEAEFVEQWVEAVRGSTDPRLKDIGILIRPHPARLDEWKNVDLSGYRNLTFWGAHPVNVEAKGRLLRLDVLQRGRRGLEHQRVSSMPLSFGKPAHTVLLDDVSSHNQEGTIHFHYLLDVNGGLLRAARSFPEHISMLADTLAGEGGGDPKAERFVEAFIRPYGSNVAASPRFADAVEEVGRQPAQPATVAGPGAGSRGCCCIHWPAPCGCCSRRSRGGSARV